MLIFIFILIGIAISCFILKEKFFSITTSLMCLAAILLFLLANVFVNTIITGEPETVVTLTPIATEGQYHIIHNSYLVPQSKIEYYYSTEIDEPIAQYTKLETDSKGLFFPSSEEQYKIFLPLHEAKD